MLVKRSLLVVFVFTMILGLSLEVFVFSNSPMLLSSFAASDQIVYNSMPSASSPPQLLSGCSRMTLNVHQSKIPSFSGRPAVLVFGCGRGGNLPALLTVGSRHSSLTFVPTFSLPFGWSLGIARVQPSMECSSSSPSRLLELTSGGPATLTPLTQYIYCLTATSASSFSTFSIAWSS